MSAASKPPQRPPPPDPDRGLWRGRSVAHRFESPDGMVVLVGRNAADNDVLSLKLARSRDFWLHAAGVSGSHVIVRNPQNLERLPRQTQQLAADLAAAHSKARSGGKVAVHLARAGDVSKPRGLPPGRVVVRRHQTVYGDPRSHS